MGWSFVILLFATALLWWTIKTPTSGNLLGSITSGVTGAVTGAAKSVGTDVVKSATFQTVPTSMQNQPWYQAFNPINALHGFGSIFP